MKTKDDLLKLYDAYETDDPWAENEAKKIIKKLEKEITKYGTCYYTYDTFCDLLQPNLEDYISDCERIKRILEKQGFYVYWDHDEPEGDIIDLQLTVSVKPLAVDDVSSLSEIRELANICRVNGYRYFLWY